MSDHPIYDDPALKLATSICEHLLDKDDMHLEDFWGEVQSVAGQLDRFAYAARFPDCKDNDHCKSRREHGNGECGCFHDSLGMLANGTMPKIDPTKRLWTNGQHERAVANARKQALEDAAKLIGCNIPGHDCYRNERANQIRALQVADAGTEGTT